MTHSQCQVDYVQQQERLQLYIYYSYDVRNPGYTLGSRKLENGRWKSEVEN